MTNFIFETEHYAVRPAPGEIPVRFNDAGVAVVKMDGYQIVNLETQQVDGESRNAAEAMVMAIQWSKVIDDARTATSKIQRLGMPNIPNPALS